jgi:hypothetical protein
VFLTAGSALQIILLAEMIADWTSIATHSG